MLVVSLSFVAGVATASACPAQTILVGSGEFIMGSDAAERRLAYGRSRAAASRGDDGALFPWGDAWSTTRLNSAASGIDGTTRVDRYPAGASPYGLLDAAGNVFQWTATVHDDGRSVLKGCAWDDELSLCRPAFRHGRPPSSRHILIGFRCAGPAL